MRNLHELDQYRLKFVGQWPGDGTCGAFAVPSKIDGSELRVIASSECGWDHVSVSRSTRCPNWPEMEQIRRLFFRPEEAAFQYHAPLADYVDGSFHGHPYCLHLWRPQTSEIPKPPKWMVGGMPPEQAEAEMRKAISEAAA